MWKHNVNKCLTVRGLSFTLAQWPDHAMACLVQPQIPPVLVAIRCEDAFRWVPNDVCDTRNSG